MKTRASLLALFFTLLFSTSVMAGNDKGKGKGQDPNNHPNNSQGSQMGRGHEEGHSSGQGHDNHQGHGFGHGDHDSGSEDSGASNPSGNNGNGVGNTGPGNQGNDKDNGNAGGSGNGHGDGNNGNGVGNTGTGNQGNDNDNGNAGGTNDDHSGDNDNNNNDNDDNNNDNDDNNSDNDDNNNDNDDVDDKEEKDEDEDGDKDDDNETVSEQPQKPRGLDLNMVISTSVEKETDEAYNYARLDQYVGADGFTEFRASHQRKIKGDDFACGGEAGVIRGGIYTAGICSIRKDVNDVLGFKAEAGVGVGYSDGEAGLAHLWRVEGEARIPNTNFSGFASYGETTVVDTGAKTLEYGARYTRDRWSVDTYATQVERDGRESNPIFGVRFNYKFGKGK